MLLVLSLFGSVGDARSVYQLSKGPFERWSLGPSHKPECCFYQPPVESPPPCSLGKIDYDIRTGGNKLGVCDCKDHMWVKTKDLAVNKK
jgi:hypothetical protein